ncbi:TcdA/TcdB catalytic glycosyltransferase domain-containing protein [Spiroplasma eriocheiris]|uniref:GT44 domain-containing protein n=1 Tax=Spiroplasma eriocheiris TaxID=315358 RepID=A0A0H3XIY4_9MOLU|nr:TcdA/TcdB catalytic glycosyltransferase domain-containing protein [Spiroplasma eriocheiris]AHF58054.1 hypothetical protein SPE_0934 [Spiroplasma eriocheiris CCTCC M 207170]AKM54495.1 hypothetical protein SERIO_v1c09350 [Spiroplasma eriocheiris]
MKKEKIINLINKLDLFKERDYNNFLVKFNQNVDLLESEKQLLALKTIVHLNVEENNVDKLKLLKLIDKELKKIAQPLPKNEQIFHAYVDWNNWDPTYIKNYQCWSKLYPNYKLNLWTNKDGYIVKKLQEIIPPLQNNTVLDYLLKECHMQKESNYAKIKQIFIDQNILTVETADNFFSQHEKEWSEMIIKLKTLNINLLDVKENFVNLSNSCQGDIIYFFDNYLNELFNGNLKMATNYISQLLIKAYGGAYLNLDYLPEVNFNYLTKELQKLINLNQIPRENGEQLINSLTIPDLTINDQNFTPLNQTDPWLNQEISNKLNGNLTILPTDDEIKKHVKQMLMTVPMEKFLKDDLTVLRSQGYKMVNFNNLMVGNKNNKITNYIISEINRMTFKDINLNPSLYQKIHEEAVMVNNYLNIKKYEDNNFDIGKINPKLFANSKLTTGQSNLQSVLNNKKFSFANYLYRHLQSGGYATSKVSLSESLVDLDKKLMKLFLNWITKPLEITNNPKTHRKAPLTIESLISNYRKPAPHKPTINDLLENNVKKTKNFSHSQKTTLSEKVMLKQQENIEKDREITRRLENLKKSDKKSKVVPLQQLSEAKIK